MSANISETYSRTRGISGEKTPSIIIGWIVFGTGALYMLLMGWLSSWWIVPMIRQSGLQGLSGVAFFTWQLAAPVGALLVAMGAAFIGRVERSRKVIIIGGSLVVTIWLFISMGAIKQVYPTIFGIGGGLISLGFLGALLDWARSRHSLSSTARVGADFGIAGHVFYLIAAWYLCGLLGAPTFLLRSELAMTILPENAAISLGTTILICMTLGSLFTFLSRRVVLLNKD